MKKNKTFTYILLIVVVGLWIVVFYRIYNSFFSDKQMSVYDNNSVPRKKILAETKETFVLKVNYNDPFLGKSFTSRPVNMLSANLGSVSSVSNKKPIARKKEEVVIDWSFINYFGLIKNHMTSKQVALVSLNGSQYMVSEGGKVEEVTFVKNYKDSIKVSFRGVTAFLKKK